MSTSEEYIDELIVDLNAVKKERNELAAQVERLINTLDIIDKNAFAGAGNSHEIADKCLVEIFHTAVDAQKETPDQSLAAVRDEAVESFARKAGVFDSEYDDQGYVEISKQAVKDYAQRIRNGG